MCTLYTLLAPLPPPLPEKCLFFTKLFARSKGEGIVIRDVRGIGGIGKVDLKLLSPGFVASNIVPHDCHMQTLSPFCHARLGSSRVALRNIEEL